MLKTGALVEDESDGRQLSRWERAWVRLPREQRQPAACHQQPRPLDRSRKGLNWLREAIDVV